MPARLGTTIVVVLLAGALGRGAVATPPPPTLPLTPEQVRALADAADQTDVLEPAFDVLADAAANLDLDPDELPGPPLALLLNEPDAHRGVLFAFRGIVQQTTRRPDAHTIECFLRRPGAPPFVLYLVGPDADLEPPAAGSLITGVGAFYKVLGADARDGSRRIYPAFVGRIVAVQAGGGVSPAALIAAFAVLAVALVILRRRIASIPDRERTPPVAPAVAEKAALPDDPAEALAEMARRAESTDPLDNDDKEQA